jgi:hypothetical protein
LEPGADLKFSALAPGGENRDRFVEAQIWRNGKRLDLSQQYDYDARTYRGLPLGKYEVRILSSAEQAAGRKWSETISSPPYAGRTIKVTLDGQTPLVDLGQIQLEPVRQP